MVGVEMAIQQHTTWDETRPRVEVALQQYTTARLARVGVRGGGGAHGVQLKGVWKSSMMLRMLT